MSTVNLSFTIFQGVQRVSAALFAVGRLLRPASGFRFSASFHGGSPADATAQTGRRPAPGDGFLRSSVCQ